MPPRSPFSVLIDSLLAALLLPAAALAQVTVQEYPLPARVGVHDVWADPAPDGPVRFSAQGSGHLGRLDPKSGEMKVFDAPRGRGPYGIHAMPQGVVYYASLAGSHIARIESDRAVVIEPPTKGQGARRVWSDSRGVIWVSEWNSGQLSRFDPRFDPATEKFESFHSRSSNANVRQIHGRKGEVWTPESSSGKLVVYRFKSRKVSYHFG